MWEPIYADWEALRAFLVVDRWNELDETTALAILV